MKIVLGVSGGIAAYKAAELVRELQRAGAEVQVVITSGATHFVSPLTLATLSKRQVMTSLWRPDTAELASGEPQPFDIEHVAIAQWADALLIAPATANVVARLAHGIADDLLTTVALASAAPLVVAPAMNVNMWQHPATRANIQLLQQRGAKIIEPASGDLACGMVGEGRLADLADIASLTLAAGAVRRDLAGQRILITAGGTREPIDPLRYLGNRSTGKMGVALAEAAVRRGADVAFITSAGGVQKDVGEQILVETAEQMRNSVMERLHWATIVMMVAAVADYRPVSPALQKIKKSGKTLLLELEQTPDILAEVAHSRRPGTIVVGFAAETESVLEEGRRKLHAKGVDAIIANDVSSSSSGIGADQNRGALIFPDRELPLPLMSKYEMASRIWDEICSRSTGATLRISLK